MEKDQWKKIEITDEDRYQIRRNASWIDSTLPDLFFLEEKKDGVSVFHGKDNDGTEFTFISPMAELRGLTYCHAFNSWRTAYAWNLARGIDPQGRFKDEITRNAEIKSLCLLPTLRRFVFISKFIHGMLFPLAFCKNLKKCPYSELLSLQSGLSESEYRELVQYTEKPHEFPIVYPEGIEVDVVFKGNPKDINDFAMKAIEIDGIHAKVIRYLSALTFLVRMWARYTVDSLQEEAEKIWNGRRFSSFQKRGKGVEYAALMKEFNEARKTIDEQGGRFFPDFFFYYFLEEEDEERDSDATKLIEDSEPPKALEEGLDLMNSILDGLMKKYKKFFGSMKVYGTVPPVRYDDNQIKIMKTESARYLSFVSQEEDNPTKYTVRKGSYYTLWVSESGDTISARGFEPEEGGVVEMIHDAFCSQYFKQIAENPNVPPEVTAAMIWNELPVARSKDSEFRGSIKKTIERYCSKMATIRIHFDITPNTRNLLFKDYEFEDSEEETYLVNMSAAKRRKKGKGESFEWVYVMNSAPPLGVISDNLDQIFTLDRTILPDSWSERDSLENVLLRKAIINRITDMQHRMSSGKELGNFSHITLSSMSHYYISEDKTERHRKAKLIGKITSILTDLKRGGMIKSFEEVSGTNHYFDVKPTPPKKDPVLLEQDPREAGCNKAKKGGSKPPTKYLVNRRQSTL